MFQSHGQSLLWTNAIICKPVDERFPSFLKTAKHTHTHTHTHARFLPSISDVNLSRQLPTAGNRIGCRVLFFIIIFFSSWQRLRSSVIVVIRISFWGEMKNSKNFGKNLGRETRYINIFFLILRKLRNSRRNYGQRLRGTTSFHSVSFHFFLNPAILSRRGTRDNYFNLSKTTKPRIVNGEEKGTASLSLSPSYTVVTFFYEKNKNKSSAFRCRVRIESA